MHSLQSLDLTGYLGCYAGQAVFRLEGEFPPLRMAECLMARQKAVAYLHVTSCETWLLTCSRVLTTSSGLVTMEVSRAPTEADTIL